LLAAAALLWPNNSLLKLFQVGQPLACSLSCALLAGIPCLFANLSVAAWIKFDKSLLSQLLTTIVLMLALVSMGYSRKWSAHILETERTELVCAYVSACTLHMVSIMLFMLLLGGGSCRFVQSMLYI
jgi:hypothetical protein